MAGTYPTHFAVELLHSFASVFDRLREQGLLTPYLTLEQLTAPLNAGQKELVRQILELKPEDYGVHTPFIGLEPVPAGLVLVVDQIYTEHGEQKMLGEKYVPAHVHEAFKKMNEAFASAHPGRALLIESAYRSPASQVITFINWCTKAYDGDIGKTIRHASPPAYSQHTSASKTAIDIKNIDGSPLDDDLDAFKTTVEYAWLCKHAQEFGFYESWPEGNEFGMRAEPWHWQYRGAGNS